MQIIIDVKECDTRLHNNVCKLFVDFQDATHPLK